LTFGRYRTARRRRRAAMRSSARQASAKAHRDIAGLLRMDQ
jgi:hypothetical protein